jgi:glycosyltransferase involved in cell wall biosynthesis
VALQAIFLAKIFSPKTKFIVESARGSYFRLPWPFRIILRYVLNHIDILYARSIDVAELYKKCFGYKGRILVVPNGVSKTEKFIRAKKNVKTIGFVGKLAKHKGVDVLVEAFKKITGNYRLLLIGKNELNIRSEKNITVIGPVKHSEVNNYLKQIDIFVLPSITANKWIDTFPRVLIEAMALSIPVLGSSSGEISRIIGRKDLVFKENSVAALYQKLNLILKDERKLKSIADYCRERVEKNYTWAKVSEIIVSGYSEVLKK